MVNDRVGDGVGVDGTAERAHRATLLGVAERELERRLRRRHALDGRAHAACVDEGEHMVESAVGRADEPPARVLKLELARR